MSSAIEIPFAVGERVWWVGNERHQEWVECPECAGATALTLIQGNGEQVSIDCACCRRGYEPPSGFVTRTRYRHEPTPFTPGRVDIRGDEIQYSESGPDANCYGLVYAKDLFVDKEECAKRCAELNAERDARDAGQVIRNMESKRKDLAWSVHYWGRKVKELERDLAAARERLNRSKARKSESAEVES